jgi:hypothetical protein
VVVLAVEACQSCGADLRGEPIEQVSACQVHDLPPIKLHVTEYRAEAKTCPHCQQLNQAAFPVEVSVLHDRLRSADVAHFDETGLRVNQRLWWLHVACTAQFTAYSVQRERGTDGMDAMGILPEFQGKAIHDGWKSYESYPCAHFLIRRNAIFEWLNSSRKFPAASVPRTVLTLLPEFAPSCPPSKSRA